MQDKSKPDTGANGQSDATPLMTSVAASLSREVQNVLADAEDLIKATTSLTGTDLTRARARLAKGVEAARESIQRVGSVIAANTRKAATATDDYVHEQPWKAIGAGAAIAFLVGVVVARRR